MNRILLITLVAGLLATCKVEPAEVEYGKDLCHYCKMTIVGTQHAAQIVTSKGKAYKYDAIECMMRHLAEWEGTPVELYLVNDYATPKKMIDATQAHFLISPAIPSPMGAFLSAFEDNNLAQQTLKDKGGDLYSWVSLKKKYQVK